MRREERESIMGLKMGKTQATGRLDEQKKLILFKYWLYNKPQTLQICSCECRLQYLFGSLCMRSLTSQQYFKQVFHVIANWLKGSGFLMVLMVSVFRGDKYWTGKQEGQA